jgi:hypothetical protein
MTVSGRTMIRADFQFFQIALSLNPKQSIPTVQSRTFIVSREDGQLLTKCHSFQRDMSVSTEQENDESHYDDNCIQHEKATVPPSMKESTD